MTKRLTQSRTWTADEMRAFVTVPFNRNLEDHARDLLRNGYDGKAKSCATNFMVAFVAETRTYYRLNGNTRTHLDATGRVPLPRECHGVLIFCETLADAREEYDLIDIPESVKGAHDRLDTVFSTHGITDSLQSKFFLAHKGTSAFAVAWNAMRGVESNATPKPRKRLDEVVVKFRPAILAIDAVLAKYNVGASGDAVFTAVISTMILTYMRATDASQKVKAREAAVTAWTNWWGAYHKDQGEGNTNDPWVKAWHIVEKAAKGGKREEIYKAVNKLLRCYEWGADPIEKSDRTGKQNRVVAIHLERYYPIWEEQRRRETAANKAGTFSTSDIASLQAKGRMIRESVGEAAYAEYVKRYPQAAAGYVPGEEAFCP